jgi:hypothetical protein
MPGRRKKKLSEKKLGEKKRAMGPFNLKAGTNLSPQPAQTRNMPDDPALHIFDVTINVGGGTGSFERIVRGLAREARKAAADRTYMSRVKFSHDCEELDVLDSLLPLDKDLVNLAGLLAMNDVLEAGKDAQVCTRKYRNGHCIQEYTETGNQGAVIWTKYNNIPIWVFHASNVDGGGPDRGTLCQRQWWCEVREDMNRCYMGMGPCSIELDANAIAKYCPKKWLYEVDTKKRDRAVARRLAIAQIAGIPEDVRRLLGDMDDSWFDVEHSMNSRGMPGCQRSIPAPNKRRCYFCNKKLKTVQGRLAHTRACADLHHGCFGW